MGFFFKPLVCSVQSTDSRAMLCLSLCSQFVRLLSGFSNHSHSGLLNLVQPPIYLYTHLLGCVSHIVLSYCIHCDELKPGLVRNIKILPECTVWTTRPTCLWLIKCSNRIFALCLERKIWEPGLCVAAACGRCWCKQSFYTCCNTSKAKYIGVCKCYMFTLKASSIKHTGWTSFFKFSNRWFAKSLNVKLDFLAICFSKLTQLIWNTSVCPVSTFEYTPTSASWFAAADFIPCSALQPSWGLCRFR